jgi:carbonic anhydrase
VRRIRTHPLVPPTIQIYGYLYDVKTGALVEVPEATDFADGPGCSSVWN